MKHFILIFVWILISPVLFAQIKWEKFTVAKKSDLSKAYIAGKGAGGENIFIARAQYQNGLHPGKFQKGRVFIGYGGKEVALNSAEILTCEPNTKLSWVAWTGSVPDKAVIGGNENGGDLYICRANYNNELIPGKLLAGKCNISQGGAEIEIASNFEVLVEGAGGSKGGKERDDVAVKTGTEIGNKAPELSYKSPSGKVIALSSLKGKMVLIDFWASWCGPCRRENPTVVAAYNKYKNSAFKNGTGFTVYSVSLDTNGENWKKAISADKLAWEYHVSDLGGWNSDGAVKYGVSSIPANFLIDANGIIVAKDLRGTALETELKKHLK